MNHTVKVALCAFVFVYVAAAKLGCGPGERAPETVTQAPTEEMAAPAPEQIEADAAEKTGRVEYAPHVLIDFATGQVEIDARVARREGMLELLICAEQTKEHESVLVTAAQPRKIYEAMGLIGLEPGAPPQYDPETKTATLGTGQRLALEIVCEVEGEAQRIAAHEWLAAKETLAPVPPPSWIFCGSRIADDRFLADVDGTIACVVDFDTAIIGLAASHSASDAELWVAANTPRIPAEDTPCTLIVRALPIDPLVIELTPENYFALGDSVIDALQLDALIKERIRHNPEQQVQLSPAPDTPNDFARVAGRCIIGSGIARENLVLTLHPEEPAAAESEAADTPVEGN